MGTKKNRSAQNVLTETDERLVGTREVLERIPIHRSTLSEMIAAKRFPAPLKLTQSKLLWRWSTILQWLENLEKHPVKRRAFQNIEKALAANRARAAEVKERRARDGADDDKARPSPR